MIGGKILKIFKKGAKAASKQSGKKGSGAKSSWPSGTRIGVFGHANSGKTVYLTVLNEECKISKKLQLSVTDNRTAGEFLNNYRSIWGLGSSNDAGTVVDFRGDKRFPEPTSTEKLLSFNAIIDQSNKLSTIIYDYSGKAVSISGSHDSTERVIDFMSGCDGILFFYDPKLLGAELESQAHVAAFINMLEQLAPLTSHRLPIPVGIVITKSDILPGYKGEEHVQLVGGEDEHLISEEFEIFYEKILALPRVTSDAEWAKSVRNVLFRLKDFLRVILKRTLDFQMFFVSATGVTPEKVGAEVGRGLYIPPDKMQPIGVKDPFYWIFKAIIRNKRIAMFRKAAKYVAVASVIWLILLSIPYAIHFGYTFKKPFRVEQSYLKGRDMESLSGTDKTQIKRAFTDYRNSRLAKSFLFEDFRAPTGRILKVYEGNYIKNAKKELAVALKSFLTVVSDTDKWPKFIKTDDSAPEPNPIHQTFLAIFNKYHDEKDSASSLFGISDRALERWDLFLTGVRGREVAENWQSLQNRVNVDAGNLSLDRIPEEKTLDNALASIKIETEKKVEIAKKTVGLGDLIDEINGKEDPKYRLIDVVRTLKDMRGEVDPDGEKKIKRYLDKVGKWERSQTFKYEITSIPEGHLHIEVVNKGEEPVWSDETDQILPGYPYSINWKMGQIIHIAYDAPGAAEKYGKFATAKQELRGKLAIFDFDGEISFGGTSIKVVISVNPKPSESLPKMER